MSYVLPCQYLRLPFFKLQLAFQNVPLEIIVFPAPKVNDYFSEKFVSERVFILFVYKFVMHGKQFLAKLIRGIERNIGKSSRVSVKKTNGQFAENMRLLPSFKVVMDE